ncbi:bifunctional phosphoglucose/phosphomannose isomerase [Candidatus Azambacteria bacterium]|nr:bifunctional phosphoglucose/phosphomannose isomerase [Candidatus Azambacteria bacterium]
MIEDSIRNFHTQFLFEPRVANEANLKPARVFVVCGMGGSAFAADAFRAANPGPRVVVHRGYGLPRAAEREKDETLVIAVSYSGNTEETIDAFNAARAAGLAVAAVASGGKLKELALACGAPFVEIPAGIQPRMALGYLLKAQMKLMGYESGLRNVSALASLLDSSAYEEKGKVLAGALFGKIPVVYASGRNGPVAYNWKVKFNEGAKIPAFWNMFPELNHNEMTGFDVTDATKTLSERFHFIFLTDTQDHPRLRRRMEVTRRMLSARGFGVTTEALAGDSPWEKICASLLVADWAAYHLARSYGTEPEKVPMIEEFKKMI